MISGDVYLLGIDGGGTSCRARLCDAEGETLGEGCSGGANVRLGLENAYRSILDATRQALDQAGLAPSVLARTYAGFGLAGAVTPEIRQAVRAFRHPFAEVVVETDAHTACLGAHNGGEGGILILGTGSCGVALVDHRFHNVGGWGFPISDHASGAWIGLRLVRYALQAHEGVVPATALSEALMAQFDHSPPALVSWMDQAKPRDYGAFAPLVMRYAKQDDPLANQLLQKTAAEAGELLKRLRELGAPKICLMGGLSAVVASWLPPGAQACLAEPQGDAMDGALLLVRQQLFERQRGLAGQRHSAIPTQRGNR